MLQDKELQSVIKKLKRISTLSIILGVIVILVVIYMRGVLGSLDADKLIIAVTWGLVALGITLITLGIKSRKTTIKRARTYSLISIFIIWVLFLVFLVISFVLGIASGLIILMFIICLIISHINLRAVDNLLPQSESEEN